MLDNFPDGLDERSANALRQFASTVNAQSQAHARAIPTPLYHYTTTFGLLGILSSGQLRATNFAYLNDTLEPQYGREFVIEVIGEIRRGSKNNEEQAFLEDVALRFALVARSTDLYLTCFCEDGDLLSQWRSYGETDGRYCVAFDVTAMNYDDIAFSFGPVVYDRATQLSCIRKVVAQALSCFAEQQTDSSSEADSLFAQRLAMLTAASLELTVHSSRAMRSPRNANGARSSRSTQQMMPSTYTSPPREDSSGLTHSS